LKHFKLPRLRLQTTIQLLVVALVVAGFGVTIAILTGKAGAMQQDLALQYAEQLAHNNAGTVKARMDSSLVVARGLAQALGGMRADGRLDRAQADAVLKTVLRDNPALLATWTAWEPDAFDGQDAKHANAPGSDASGRYVPYWNRGGGQIALEPLVDYDKPGAGDYYLLALRSGDDTVIEPYLYKVGNTEMLITSIAAPIKIGGKTVGVAGIDIALSDFQKEIGQIKPYGTGFASLLSNGGVYVGDLDSNQVGKNLGNDAAVKDLKDSIAAGKPYRDNGYNQRLDADVFRVYVPVQLGDTKTPWSFGITVPQEQIFAEVRELRNVAVGLALASVLVVSIGLGLALHRLLFRKIGGEPGDAVDLAHAVARGDLSATVPLKPGDRASMLFSMTAMQNRLAALVQGIRDSSEAVSLASSEIADGNSDLSRRTERQAASIEETASSTQELLAMVERTSGNAHAVNKLAVCASDTAARGGREVGQAVVAMSEIARESGKMVEIISSIEGIAFQTNILALNAAVEAARAGEQGRGFAVVASEVRNLAHRSAAASKEIRALIESSVSQVNRGAELVTRAGATMDEVTTSVRQVTTIISDISQAADEQNSGIAQINAAIAQMDDVSRQNAALVDQAATAAASLEDQARHLKEAVSVFRLADGGAGGMTMLTRRTD
jgi:methyl-accepting chemotaxis protein